MADGDVITPRICKGCKQEFPARRKNGLWCGRACYFKHREMGRRRARRVRVTYNCGHCGVLVDKMVARGNRRKNIFCSCACAGLHKSAVAAALRESERARKRTERLAAKAIQAAALMERASAAAVKPCAQCGTGFDSRLRRWKPTCSDECQIQRLRERRRQFKRTPAGRAAKHSHKARRRSIEVEHGVVDPFMVLQRDGWRCYMCGVSTPESLRGSNEPTAPEVDHVIPLALGGMHVDSNLRCCCRQCNGRKGASLPCDAVTDRISA